MRPGDRFEIIDKQALRSFPGAELHDVVIVRQIFTSLQATGERRFVVFEIEGQTARVAGSDGRLRVIDWRPPIELFEPSAAFMVGMWLRPDRNRWIDRLRRRWKKWRTYGRRSTA